MTKIITLLLMASAYLFAHRLEVFSVKMRTAIASFSGGVASAYVFLFVLPKLASQQAILEHATYQWPVTEYLYHHAYIVALLGFATYYLTGMVTYVKNHGLALDTRARLGILMLVLYAATMGEVTSLSLNQAGTPSLLLTFALWIHLVGLNYLLSDHLKDTWNWLRWILLAGFTAGWLAGNFLEASPGFGALLSAWLAGSIIIHVILIELPENRSFSGFVAGILVFTLLLKLYLYIQGVEGAI